MRVLVTGAAGFIGGAVAARLVSDGHDVTGLDLVVRDGLASVVADLGDPALAETLGSLGGFDAVVHAGARVGWDGASRPELFRPNVMGTGVLADWASRIDARMCFLSAALVCGSRRLITAGTPPAPENDYTYTKWLGEELVACSGARAAVLRLAGVFGPDGPGHLGINRAIATASLGQRPVIKGDGSARRNYAYVRDVAASVAHCLGVGLTGTHLVGGPRPESIADMVGQVCEVLAPGLEPVREPSEGEAADQLVEHSATLPPGRSFREAIEDIAGGV